MKKACKKKFAENLDSKKITSTFASSIRNDNDKNKKMAR